MRERYRLTTQTNRDAEPVPVPSLRSNKNAAVSDARHWAEQLWRTGNFRWVTVHVVRVSDGFTVFKKELPSARRTRPSRTGHSL